MFVAPSLLETLRDDLWGVNLGRMLYPLVTSFGVIITSENERTQAVLTDELQIIEATGAVKIKPGYAGVAGTVHLDYPDNIPPVDVSYPVVTVIPVEETSAAQNIPTQDQDYYVILKPKKVYMEPHAEACTNCYEGEDKLRYADSYEVELRLTTGDAPDISKGEVWLANVIWASGSGIITITDKRQQNILRLKTPLIPRYVPIIPGKPVIWKNATGLVKDLHPTATPEQKAKFGNECYIQVYYGYSGQGQRDGSDQKKFNISPAPDPTFSTDMWDGQKLLINNGGTWEEYTIDGGGTDYVTVTEDLPSGGPFDCMIGLDEELYVVIIVPKDESNDRDWSKYQSFIVERQEEEDPTPIQVITRGWRPDTKHDIFVRAITIDGYRGPYSDDMEGQTHPSIDAETPSLEEAKDEAMQEDKSYPSAPKLIHSTAAFEIGLAGGYTEDEEGLAPKTCYCKWEWGAKLTGVRDPGNPKKVDFTGIEQTWTTDCWKDQYLSYYDDGAAEWKKSKITANTATSGGAASITVEDDLPSGSLSCVPGPGAWGYKLVQFMLNESEEIIEETQVEAIVSKDSRADADAPTPPMTMIQGLLPGKTYRAKVKSLSPGGEYETEFSQTRDQVMPDIQPAAPPIPKIVGVEEKCAKDWIKITNLCRAIQYSGEGAAVSPAFAGDAVVGAHLAGNIGSGAIHIVWWGDEGTGDKNGSNPYRLDIVSAKWTPWTVDFWNDQKLVIGTSVFDIVGTGTNWVEVDNSGDEIPAGTGHDFVIGPNAAAYELEEEVLDTGDSPVLSLSYGKTLMKKFSPVPVYKAVVGRLPHAKYRYKVRSVAADKVTKSNYSDWKEVISGENLARISWGATQEPSIAITDTNAVEINIPIPDNNANLIEQYELVYQDDGVDADSTSEPGFANGSRQAIIPAAKNIARIHTRPARFVKVAMRTIDCLGRPSLLNNLTIAGPTGASLTLKPHKTLSAIYFDVASGSGVDRDITITSEIPNVFWLVQIDVYLKSLTGATKGYVRVYPEGFPEQAEVVELTSSHVGKGHSQECELLFSNQLTIHIDTVDPAETDYPAMKGAVSVTYREPERT